MSRTQLRAAALSSFNWVLFNRALLQRALLNRGSLTHRLLVVFPAALVFSSAAMALAAPPRHPAAKKIAAPAQPQPPLRLAPDSATALLEQAVADDQLIASAVVAQVRAALREAGDLAARDPSTARKNLKLVLHGMLSVPQLSAAVRADLRAQLEGALRSVDRQARDFENRQYERQSAAAAAREHDRVLAGLENDQQKTKQLLDRFDSLLAEGRFDLAQEITAALDESTGRSENPAQPEAASARNNLAVLRGARQAIAARLARQQGLVDTLQSVELTNVARSDEQPIIYPRAEVWQELTTRRASAARTDMKQPTPAEARLHRALAETTTFDFAAIPLADAIDYLKDLHGIEIQLDVKALESVGLERDLPVTMKLSGVTLRSALRLLLGTVELSYVLENEVLLITTPERGSERLITKVYPVEQLVLPIRTPNFTGGFGQLGGFGGGGQSGMNGFGQNSGQSRIPGMNNGQGQNPFGQAPF